MHREYHKWYSEHLNKEMELLIFGSSGKPVLLFPTRCARFFDYENWQVLDGIKDKIDQGLLQIYCVDSVDKESFYNPGIPGEERLKRHLQYENYIIREVLPLIRLKNQDPFLISAGCSMGAYHAVNTAFKHPHLFSKVLGMSGRYDLTYAPGHFNDLLDTHWSEDVYFNMPSQYLSNLDDLAVIEQIQRMEIILVLGKDDLFLGNNLLLSKLLQDRNIQHQLYLWEDEAHKPWYWKLMLREYL